MGDEPVAVTIELGGNHIDREPHGIGRVQPRRVRRARRGCGTGRRQSSPTTGGDPPASACSILARSSPSGAGGDATGRQCARFAHGRLRSIVTT